MTEHMKTQKDLAVRTPETRLEAAEEWATLSDEGRKRRAAEAIRDGDTEALQGLLRAHLLTFGKKGLRVSRHTLTAYSRGLVTLLAFCDAPGLKAHQLTRQEALRYTRHLEAAALKPASVNLKLAAARAFVQALLWAGLVSADPFARVSVADPVPLAEKRHPYAETDLAALLNEADPRERILVLLGADAGLRVAEVAALEWADVDLASASLVVTVGKGGKRRTVAITPRTVEGLAAVRPTEASGPVFGITVRRLQAILQALCWRAGVKHRGFHSLRHSAGTRLYSVTKDLKVVARHLGHATTRPSELYAHLADEDYRQAVQALGEAKRAAAWTADRRRTLRPGRRGDLATWRKKHSGPCTCSVRPALLGMGPRVGAKRTVPNDDRRGRRHGGAQARVAGAPLCPGVRCQRVPLVPPTPARGEGRSDLVKSGRLPSRRWRISNCCRSARISRSLSSAVGHRIGQVNG